MSQSEHFCNAILEQGVNKEDMEEIEKKWDTMTYDQRTSEIYSVMVIYQNQRANGSVNLLE